jgi:ATP-binding cassette subfamily B protein
VVAALGEVVLAALGALLSYLTTYLIGAVSERVGADLRAAVHAHLLRLSLRFHDTRRTGDLVPRLTGDVSRVEDALVSWLSTLLPRLLSLAGILGLLLAIDPLMAAAGLAMTPLLGVVHILRRRAIQPVQNTARDEQGRLASHLTEVLRNVRAIQAFADEPESRRRFTVRNRVATRSNLEALDVSSRYAPLADVVLSLGSGLVLLLGVVRVTSGRMTVGVFLVVVTYIFSLYSPIRSLTRLGSTLAKRAASQDRIVEILASDELVPEDPDPLPLTGVSSAVTFHGVSFAYRPGMEVLRGLSLRIAAGGTTGVVGPTGAGKSTILSLLVRLYDPDEGSIDIDGTDLRRFRLSALRERIALVPQDPWLMDGSIRDNIALGRPHASDAEVMSAARLALVDEFAERLPGGYECTVGEGGVQLSGGQRRRLAIARALLRDAAILLLDEPTTGLDAGSEAEVLEAIRQAGRGRTVVLVTHSLRLAASADRVVVVREGTVVEEGAPAHLEVHDGVYGRLWRLQQPIERFVPNGILVPEQQAGTAATHREGGEPHVEVCQGSGEALGADQPSQPPPHAPQQQQPPRSVTTRERRNAPPLPSPSGQTMEATRSIGDDPHGDERHERFLPGEEMLPGLLAWVMLGDGNRCETWLAWSTELWAPVAVKLPLANGARLQDDASRLAREAANLAALSHPAIERLLIDRHDDAIPHLVKEYVEGPNLALLVEAEGPFESADAIRLGMQIASGLHHIHGRGLVHLDLKPHNVVLREGRAVILDLDLAKRVHTAVPADQHRAEGSAPWMAPEQCRLRPAHPQMDVFALGAVLYEISTGVRPFRGTRRAYPQLTTRPRPPRAVRPEISGPLEEVISALMEPEPEHRPSSALEALALLESALPPGEEALWPQWAGRMLRPGAPSDAAPA